MEIIIEQNIENKLFEEVAFYKGMLGDFSYNPREFCITFDTIHNKPTDVLRYIGTDKEIHIPAGVIAIPYLLPEGYSLHKQITIVNHSQNLIDIDYMLCNTLVEEVELKGFGVSVHIQTAESAFEGTNLEKINVSNLNLAKCRNMIRMFSGTLLRQIDVSCVYLKNDADLSYMFVGCSQLEQVKLFNNGAGSKLNLKMEQIFHNCNNLRDLCIFDADDFFVESYQNNIETIIPAGSLLCQNLITFFEGFVPEFDDQMGIALNEAFDIKVINEYSMLLRKATAKEMYHHVQFVFRMLQELQMEMCGTQGAVEKIHFVSDIQKEKEKISEIANGNRKLLVQPRRDTEQDVLIYALYLDKNIRGYRVKYRERYYDISSNECAELGFTSIAPRKKLRLKEQDGAYYVCQNIGEEIPIYGYRDLVQAMGFSKKEEE